MLQNLFEQAFQTFLLNESENIGTGVSERNLCARLAMSLEREAANIDLIGYYADPEYNRKQNGQVKTILDDDLHVVNITCDIILHSRGEIVSRDNLIAIEMKKSDRPEHEKQSDRTRIRALTKTSYDGVYSYDGVTHPEHVCGYEVGYYLELNRQQSLFLVERYQVGELCSSEEISYGL